MPAVIIFLFLMFAERLIAIMHRALPIAFYYLLIGTVESEKVFFSLYKKAIPGRVNKPFEYSFHLVNQRKHAQCAETIALLLVNFIARKVGFSCKSNNSISAWLARLTAIRFELTNFLASFTCYSARLKLSAAIGRSGSHVGYYHRWPISTQRLSVSGAGAIT
jgi:hypothetical protein